MADTLTITDNRTGKQYEIPIEHGAIRAMDLRKIRSSDDDFGLMTYDPAFQNTAACKSRITFIDGDKGILRYRGYPIEQLAAHSDFLETAYLLLFGELPTAGERTAWTQEVNAHRRLPSNVASILAGFNHDAHAMGVFLATVGALSTDYPDAKHVLDKASRSLQIRRLIAKAPSIGAHVYRHSLGLPYVETRDDLGFTANFLNMLFSKTGKPYHVHPVLERALEVLFILHADHEQNCSTHAMRGIGSSQADPFSALAGAAAALYGPLHGGANEAVLLMLEEIASVKNIPAFIAGVKKGQGRLMGFGHRVYKHGDSRVPTMSRYRDIVADATGGGKWVEISKIVADEMMEKKGIHPNLDFPAGPAYFLMGFPIDFFTPLFVASRITGWAAHVIEQGGDNRLIRPLSVYTGKPQRDVVPIRARG